MRKLLTILNAMARPGRPSIRITCMLDKRDGYSVRASGGHMIERYTLRAIAVIEKTGHAVQV
jgi:hypothetical protein